MTTVKAFLVGTWLGLGVCGLLAACSSAPQGAAYTDAELRAACEREGGWWRGALIPGYCEPPGATMP
ncbi:MAG TPA: hypothetical protein VLK35_02635 [Methylomirabilota bacterium]|nr:hypothetical protein [Methylomirabilota bacterium]